MWGERGGAEGMGMSLSTSDSEGGGGGRLRRGMGGGVGEREGVGEGEGEGEVDGRWGLEPLSVAAGKENRAHHQVHRSGCQLHNATPGECSIATDKKWGGKYSYRSDGNYNMPKYVSKRGDQAKAQLHKKNRVTPSHTLDLRKKPTCQ